MGNLLVSLLIGLIAGWLAGNFVRGRGFGIVGDTIIGLIGGLIGGLLAGLLGIEASNTLGSILVSFFGAVVFLAVAKAVRRTDI